jgi:hypothetical protein
MECHPARVICGEIPLGITYTAIQTNVCTWKIVIDKAPAVILAAFLDRSNIGSTYNYSKKEELPISSTIVFRC